MLICKKCGKEFPYTIKVEGKIRNLQSRSFCLNCNPFGSRRRINLEEEKIDPGLHKCSKCGETKLSDQFYNRKKGKFSNYCKSCNTKYTTERGINSKKKAVEYKGGKCIDCGIVSLYVIYDFHHTGNKDFNISRMRLMSWKRIKAELDKCELICSNCHRIRESLAASPNGLGHLPSD